MAVLLVNLDIPLQGVEDFVRVERNPLGKPSRQRADAEEADHAAADKRVQEGRILRVFDFSATDDPTLLVVRGGKT